jgi:RND superfamily putative drug exporter
MVAVFAIFATLSSLEFKQMGVGLATAVLIDATIIRGVLLPASMKLLGDRNWYLPRWLEWLPKVELEGPAPEPAAAAHARLPALEIEVEERERGVHVSLSGELDLAQAPALHERLEEVERGKPELLVLDLRRLEFMDSSGLREIIGAVRRGRAESRRVVLVKGHGPIEQVLDVTRVGEFAETVEDPAAVGFPDDGA